MSCSIHSTISTTLAEIIDKTARQTPAGAARLCGRRSLGASSQTAQRPTREHPDREETPGDLVSLRSVRSPRRAAALAGALMLAAVPLAACGSSGGSGGSSGGKVQLSLVAYSTPKAAYAQ